MATITKRGNSWHVQIRISGHRSVCRTFDVKQAAVQWAKFKESEIRNVIDGKKQMYERFGNRDPLGLTGEKILLMASPNINRAGLYFLILNSRVVYVGQSRNVLSRVAKHGTNGRKFDSYFTVACDESDMDYLEQYYISTLKPEWNKANRITKRGFHSIEQGIEALEEQNMCSGSTTHVEEEVLGVRIKFPPGESKKMKLLAAQEIIKRRRLMLQ